MISSSASKVIPKLYRIAPSPWATAFACLAVGDIWRPQQGTQREKDGRGAGGPRWPTEALAAGTTQYRRRGRSKRRASETRYEHT